MSDQLRITNYELRGTRDMGRTTNDELRLVTGSWDSARLS